MLINNAFNSWITTPASATLPYWCGPTGGYEGNTALIVGHFGYGAVVAPAGHRALVWCGTGTYTKAPRFRGRAWPPQATLAPARWLSISRPWPVALPRATSRISSSTPAAIL